VLKSGNDHRNRNEWLELVNPAICHQREKEVSVPDHVRSDGAPLLHNLPSLPWNFTSCHDVPARLGEPIAVPCIDWAAALAISQRHTGHTTCPRAPTVACDDIGILQAQKRSCDLPCRRFHLKAWTWHARRWPHPDSIALRSRTCGRRGSTIERNPIDDRRVLSTVDCGAGGCRSTSVSAAASASAAALARLASFFSGRTHS